MYPEYLTNWRVASPCCPNGKVQITDRIYTLIDEQIVWSCTACHRVHIWRKVDENVPFNAMKSEGT